MFALIHNNKIQVGPRTWVYSFFREYLEENELDFSILPRVTPTGSTEPVIGIGWKILPVTIATPGYDSTYEQLEGPFYTIGESLITGTYNVLPTSLEHSKSVLRQKVTDHRYYGENKGTQFTFADNQTVTIYTNREDRGTYLQAYQLLPDGASIVFKFQGGIFRSVTKQELLSIVMTGVEWIQSAFEWEAAKIEEIDACVTAGELKLVQLTNPAW